MLFTYSDHHRIDPTNYITNIIKTIRLSKLLLGKLLSSTITAVKDFCDHFNSRHHQCRQRAHCIQVSPTVWPLNGLIVLKWLSVSQIYLLLIKLSNNSHQAMTEMDAIYLYFIILYFVEILVSGNVLNYKNIKLMSLNLK